MESGTSRGTEVGTPLSRTAGNGVAEYADAGRVPLAVVAVDRDGLVSHWSSGARRLFGVPKEDAVGHPAVDLLPVSGVLPEEDETALYGAYAAYDGLGPDLESSLDGRLSYPAAGRARLTVPGRERAADRDDDRVDVLWWAYPLVGPGRERLLVLAADAGAMRHTDDRVAVERIAPAFALHTDFPGAEELARRLPEILPSMSVDEGARIVAQILELGYPVMEFSQNDRVPVTPDWGVPRRGGRQARGARGARGRAGGGPRGRGRAPRAPRPPAPPPPPPPPP
ncbi:PAS domain-containing protein, partial [Streptomyces sp. NPDC059466]|uniref:PAS domain-containing protein n=1 Tax=Streptomyces sp. NPDC059466 TaxID=3346843 RepID=UPI0036AF2D10